MILLDTCTLLWLSSQDKKLSALAQDLIQANSDSLFVSSISAFEIALKARNEKLQLPLKPKLWFEEVLKFHGIDELPLNSDLLLKAVELPLLHRDPCDRMIIATAQSHACVILTPDPLIRQYPNLEVKW